MTMTMSNVKFVGKSILRKRSVVLLTIVAFLTLGLHGNLDVMILYSVENSDSGDYHYYNGSMDRLVELRGWERNKSLKVEDYLNLTDFNNYVRKPVDSKGFGDVQSRFCTSQVDILILVSSHPKNLDRRTAIRETWGSPSNLLSKGARIVFGLGFSESHLDDTVVGLEATVYDDIVQERYVESFNNLTFKTLSLIKWAKFACSFTNETMKSRGPKFVFKTDDDVFVNMDRVIELTKLLPEAVGIMGSVRCNAPAFTDWTNKYYIPKYLYAPSKYPGYVMGQGYLIRSTIISTLLENAQKIPLIHIEDIYVSAFIARPSQIYPYNYQFFTGLWGLLGGNFEKWVTVHKCFPNDLYRIWEERKNESLTNNSEITSLPSNSKSPINC